MLENNAKSVSGGGVEFEFFFKWNNILIHLEGLLLNKWWHEML